MFSFVTYSITLQCTIRRHDQNLSLCKKKKKISNIYLFCLVIYILRRLMLIWLNSFSVCNHVHNISFTMFDVGGKIPFYCLSFRVWCSKTTCVLLSFLLLLLLWTVSPQTLFRARSTKASTLITLFSITLSPAPH